MVKTTLRRFARVIDLFAICAATAIILVSVPASAAPRPITIVGHLENATIPLRGISDLTIKAKMDTGADMTSIHAVDINRYTKNGEEWVSFLVRARRPRSENPASSSENHSCPTRRGRRGRTPCGGNRHLHRRILQASGGQPDRSQQHEHATVGRTAFHGTRQISGRFFRNLHRIGGLPGCAFTMIEHVSPEMLLQKLPGPGMAISRGALKPVTGGLSIPGRSPPVKTTKGRD